MKNYLTIKYEWNAPTPTQFLTKNNWNFVCENAICKRPRTSEKACQDVFNYIELLYNPNRKCGKNGMLLPIDYVRQQ